MSSNLAGCAITLSIYSDGYQFLISVCILSQENPITMEYKDSLEIKITDYFDITENSWSNDGVSDALDRAVGMCNQL